jgi:hypothetical protein
MPFRSLDFYHVFCFFCADQERHLQKFNCILSELNISEHQCHLLQYPSSFHILCGPVILVGAYFASSFTFAPGASVIFCFILEVFISEWNFIKASSFWSKA